MAIDDPLDEHEQSERVLEWLRRNGIALFGGILLGLAAIVGWKWSGHRQVQQQASQAEQYQLAVDAIEANDPKAPAKVDALGSSVYAPLARLTLAASQVQAGQRDAAIAQLRGVKSGDPALAAIVDQRLARLLIDAGKPAEALKLLHNATASSALEIRGDAQFAMGERDTARATYTQALAKLDIGSPQRRLLELKLTEVGGPTAMPEAKS